MLWLKEQFQQSVINDQVDGNVVSFNLKCWLKLTYPVVASTFSNCSANW